MRTAVALATLLAVIATALVGVRAHSENRRLEYRVWEGMRRRDSLERQIRALEGAIDQTLSPRRLLEEQDRLAGETLPPERPAQDVPAQEVPR